jgi:hypothetical protein
MFASNTKDVKFPAIFCPPPSNYWIVDRVFRPDLYGPSSYELGQSCLAIIDTEFGFKMY